MRWTCRVSTRSRQLPAILTVLASLWKFIDALKKEQRLQRLNISQLLLGQVVVPKKTYRMTDECVSNLLFAIMLGLTAHLSLPSFCVLPIAHNLRFYHFNLLTKHVYYKIDWLAVSDS